MSIQIQVHSAGCWRCRGYLPSAGVEVLDRVRGAAIPIRLLDTARETVIAASQLGRELRGPRPGPGIERVRQLRLERPDALDKRAPDPYALGSPIKVRVKPQGRYKLFSQT